MTRKTLWLASLPAPVLIAMLLLFPGSPRLTANDQPSAANAEVKIDNFSFGPQTVTVPVGATVTWINRDDIPHTVVSTDGVSSPRCGIRTKPSRTRLPRREHIPTSARSTRR